MTTPPATGDGLPAWLPDEATLSRLATEFFQALPGSTSDVPGAGSSAGASSAGPVSTAPEVPSSGEAGGTGGAWPGVPSAGSVDLPAFAEPPTPAGGTSPPTGPPPTSAPATYAASAAATPLTPELPALPSLTGIGVVPDPMGVPETSAPGVVPPTVPDLSAPAFPGVTEATDPGRFYFLSEAPAVPAYTVPGYEVPADPVPVATTPPPAAQERDDAGLDVLGVRRDFPILSERVNGHQLIWLDNAATTQKPLAVIDRLSEFYRRENSNIHRAAHELAARATDAYEGSRTTVASFIGARAPEEIVFTRGTTEAINLLANTWGTQNLGSGDEILISHLEHHANIVPWQMLARRTGAVIKVIPVDDRGVLLLDQLPKLLTERTKLVAVTQVSNALGTVVPVEQIIGPAHDAGARVLVDAAQSVPHLPIDVTALDADFLVFSGHKIFGPTGIGALYGKREILDDMPPWQGGGNMIADVRLEGATYQDPPWRFEAGTGNIADAVGLGAALDYVSRVGLPAIAAHEHALVEHATAGLREVPGLRLVGTAPEKASVVSFVLDGYEPLEVGQALNEVGIAVRAGHHCAQPILRRLGLEATVRPSFAFYNTVEEADALVHAVHRLAARRR